MDLPHLGRKKMTKTDVPPPMRVTPAEQEWLDARIAALDAARAKRENFPVASRLLRAERRRQLLDVYVLARLIDDVGDEAPGDRLALLDLIDTDLDEVAGGRPSLAPVAAIVPLVRERGVPVQPFRDLVAANRMDQQVTRYADMAALRGYCRLSAEPVGRLVLALWDLGDERRTALSDDVCTGLQIAEHLQDVGEDLAAGRIYLPEDAMARHRVTPELLAAASDPAHRLTASERARIESLLADLAERARMLLAAGTPLTRLVPGVLRVAIAGFTAGGLAALDAVRAAGADAVHVTPKPRKHRVLWHTARTLTAAKLRA
jgi:squalene synthase HpnC